MLFFLDNQEKITPKEVKTTCIPSIHKFTLFCVVFFFLAHRPGSQPPPPVPGQPLLSNGNAYTYHNAYQPQPAGYYAAYPPPPPAGYPGYPGYPPPGSACLHLMLHEHNN